MRSKLFPRFFALIALAALLPWQAHTAQAAERAPQRRPMAPLAEDASQARVIVQYRASSTLMRPLAVGRAAPSPQHAATLATRLSMPMSDGWVLGKRMQALRGTGLSSAQLAQRLAAEPDVEWAVPDRRRRWQAVPADPYYSANQFSITPAVGQWYLRAPSASAFSAINAEAAWDITRGLPSVTVAVLDTGVRFDHPDLAGKLYAGYDFITDRTTANDGNGRDADPSDPGDWAAAGDCGRGEPAEDSSWHGTQVSGIIGAATDNGIGMASVGNRVMVQPVRVLGRCGGYDSDIIAGMRWAAGVSGVPVANPHPARVLNISLGSQGACDSAYQNVMSELTAAGVTVVAAAGNEAGQAVGVPANCPGVIAVAGLRHTGTKVGYSSLGPEVVVAAPAGNCVNLDGACLYPLLSTTNTGTTTPEVNTYSDSFNSTLGTSFSSPQVAGAVALMLSVDPTLTPDRVRAALRASARHFPASGADAGTLSCTAPTAAEQLECYCNSHTCGSGMLDVARAVAQVVPGSAAAGHVDDDRVFNHLEALYPQYLAPVGGRSALGAGYYHRYYPSTNAYIGTANGNVYYLVPAINNQINLLAPLADLLRQAVAAGH